MYFSLNLSVNPLASPANENSTRKRENGTEDMELDEPRRVEPRPGSSRSHYEELSTLTDIIPCCVRVQDKLSFKLFLFLMTFGLDFLDFLVDWLFFRDIYGIKPGLVYGPLENSIVYSSLFFAIIGTMAIIFEIANIGKELFFEPAWINPDIVSCLFLWVEDIPQLIIGVRIAFCREEAVSLFQVIKASALLYGIAVRITLLSLRYFSKKGIDALQGLRKGWKYAVKFLFLSGMAFIMIGSLAVFILTLFEREPNENIRFNHPKSMFEEEYNEARYFDNVSIFFNHPIFDVNMYNETKRVHFMRLLSIYEIRSKKSALFKISYDEMTRTKFVIWQEDKNRHLKAAACYRINPLRGTVTYQQHNCEHFLSNDQEVSFIFKFKFIPSSIPERRFGDIQYNVLMNELGTCHGPDVDIVTKIENHKGEGHYKSAVIHYYRHKAGAGQKLHLIVGDNNVARFYMYDEDLTDITSVWRTGFSFCKSTGNLAPDIRKDIKVECNV